MKKLVFLSALCLSAAFVAAPASASVSMTGDLNGDGVINVLDVQAAIAQTMQLLPPDLAGDLDGNGGVDITDIQNYINTALGTGGLLQRVTGELDGLSGLLQNGLQLVALSEDGDEIQAVLDQLTGQFSFTLPVGKEWLIELVTNLQGDPEAFPVQFPVDGDLSALLPLLDLSQCDILDLGSLDLSTLDLGGLVTQDDIRLLLSQINNGQFQIDAGGNDIPDFLDSLLGGLGNLGSIPGLPGDLGAMIQPLIDAITPCIQDNLTGLTTVNLIDDNGNNIPDFIEPLLLCLEDSIGPWLADSGIPPAFEQIIASLLVGNIESGIPSWLAGLDSSALVDADNNGIPDSIQGVLGDVTLPSWADANGDGIPDFLQK